MKPCRNSKPISRTYGNYFVAVILASFLLSACSVNAQKPPPSKEIFSECSGVYVFRNTGGWKEDVAVRIFGQDGSIWYQAEFNREGYDVLRDSGPNGIKPLVLIYGDYTPVFRCVSYSRNWYAVIVDETERDPVIKYMLRNDSLFEWQSWNKYYLGQWIRFDPDQNPLRQDIGSSEIIGFPGKDIPTEASKLDGDWMKLEWTTQSGEKQSGWIRWRDEKTNRVIVWFPYA